MSVSFESKETNRGVLTFTISQDQIKQKLKLLPNHNLMWRLWKKAKIGLLPLKWLQNLK